MKRFLAVGVCLFLVALPFKAMRPKSNKAAIAYLQKLQQKDGGFAPSVDQPKSSLRATDGAVKALEYFGGEIPDKAACADFVKSCFDRNSGGFADHPHGQPNVEVTAIGVITAAELKLTTAEPLKRPPPSISAKTSRRWRTFASRRRLSRRWASVRPRPTIG